MEWTMLLGFLAVPVFFIGFVVLIVVIVVNSQRQRRKQIRQWQVWAQARRWDFYESWEGILEVFSQGVFRHRRGSAEFGYEGLFDGQTVAGFAWSYTTGSDNSRQTHHFHVSLVRIPGADFPDLSIAPEEWHNQVFGEDIQFENAAFNRQWWVKGASPRFAHDVVHPRMMHLLNSDLLPSSSILWFEKDAILLCTPGKVPSDEVDARLRMLTLIVASLPRFVLEGVGRSEPVQVTQAGPGVSHEEQQRRIGNLIAERHRREQES